MKMVGIPPIDVREITKLHEMLEADKIPHSFKHVFEEFPDWGMQLCYPVFDLETRVLSVIQHIGSYGHEEGLLEIMGLLTDEELEHSDVAGWLTAEEVYERIKQHWSKENATNKTL